MAQVQRVWNLDFRQDGQDEQDFKVVRIKERGPQHRSLADYFAFICRPKETILFILFILSKNRLGETNACPPICEHLRHLRTKIGFHGRVKEVIKDQK